MGALDRFKLGGRTRDNGDAYSNDVEKEGYRNEEPIRFLRLRILAMLLIVSLGGLIFGYDIGISSR